MMVCKKNCSGQTTGWTCLILILFSIGLKAQQADPSDDLLHQARYQAFELHNYPGAIEKCKQAISHSPRDPDLRVFLGRLYTWSHFPDSARQAFGKALEDHPGYEDACIAYADLESWNDSSARALSICMNGLQFHPRSVPLLRRRASLLADLHRYREARAAADSLLAAGDSTHAFRHAGIQMGVNRGIPHRTQGALYRVAKYRGSLYSDGRA